MSYIAQTDVVDFKNSFVAKIGPVRSKNSIMFSGDSHPTHQIEVSCDHSTVWVTASDGSCVGRFSKRFGIDVHTTATEQLDGKSPCLFCTHERSGEDDWNIFRKMMLEYHSIDVPGDLIEWSA